MLIDRIWQMGFANCSTSLVSRRTVKAQVEGALTGVDEDCQYVLFKVTVPPQVVIASIKKIIVFNFRNCISQNNLYLTDAANFAQYT